MARFTDSPYEYMMALKPSVRKERDTGPPLGQSDKCRGCPYGISRPCVGFCMKDLLSGTKKKGRRYETDT